MKAGVKFIGNDTGKFWQGWPAKIENNLAFELMNEIFEADNLARWAALNRWLLNKEKLGPRILTVSYGQKVQMKPQQTLTHYHARRCIRCVQAGKLAAIDGNRDRAKMYWANAETEAERLYGSWLHTLAAKEASRVRGVKHYNESETGETRERVKKLIFSLPNNQRYERGLTSIVSKRTGLSPTQSRVHIAALGYGAKNKKHGA
jgi:hypothetical protein